MPEVKDMSETLERFSQMMAHADAQLIQSGNVAFRNFLTVQHLADLSYLEGTVTLPEALGAREVSSKEVPAGPANATRTS